MLYALSVECRSQRDHRLTVLPFRAVPGPGNRWKGVAGVWREGGEKLELGINGTDRVPRYGKLPYGITGTQARFSGSEGTAIQDMVWLLTGRT